MDRSTREVEVKLAFDSPAAALKRLEQLGAVVDRPRHFEDNFILDRTTDALAPRGITFRMRRAGERTILTLKLPVEGSFRHKVREEHETDVEDPAALESILHGLGFSSMYRYQKYRTVFRLGGLSISLDETPIGCFVELEGPPEEIDRAAKRLGYRPEQYVCETYRDLHLQVARERGAVVTDMLLEEPGDPK